MHLLDLTLDTPAENVALDEALLLTAQQSDTSDLLRLWESRQPLVVIGNSSRIADEVNLDACRAHGVVVLRRESGGAAIVAGPGCLMYSLVLKYSDRLHLRTIDQAHRFVLEAIATVLDRTSSEHDIKLSAPITRAGTSDLAVGDRKFSGNALRCKRTHLLYHGTILYRFPLEQIAALLNMPARQPDYRRHRPHTDFLMNLPLAPNQIRAALRNAFNAHDPFPNWPSALTTQLVTEKYSRPDWNARL